MKEVISCIGCGEKLERIAFFKKEWVKGSWVAKCRACTARDKDRVFYVDARDGSYYANIKHLYGIGINTYKAFFNTQGGRCAVCRVKPEGRRRLNVDMVGEALRGLLCSSCKTIVHHIERGDNVKLSDQSVKAMAYLGQPVL